MFAGLAESTMSRDDGWRFLLLGRSLERVDMTARLLSARYGESWGEAGWVTTLRSCGAYEAYLRTYQRAVDVSLAAEFLVLDRLFPRSVFTALRTAEACLAELDPSFGRAGLDDPARRSLGQARTELEFRSGDDLIGDLPGHLYRLQQHCFDAGSAIAARYFRETAPLEWSTGETSAWRLERDELEARHPAHERVPLRPERGRVLQRGPHHPADHRRSAHDRLSGRGHATRSPCQLPGLLGDARPRLRHPRPPPRARRGRIVHRRDPRLPWPDRSPRDQLGRPRRRRRRGGVLRVPRADRGDGGG